jgi:hypothetical protein
VSKSKAPFRWPLPGEIWTYVPDPAACKRGHFSQAHLDRLTAAGDAPPIYELGDRMRRRKSCDWEEWFLNRPRVTADEPAPASPVPAEPLPAAPAALPPPGNNSQVKKGRYRSRGRARKPAPTATVPPAAK